MDWQLFIICCLIIIFIGPFVCYALLAILIKYLIEH